MQRKNLCSGMVSAAVVLLVPMVALAVLGPGSSQLKASDLPDVAIAATDVADSSEVPAEVDSAVLLNDWEYTGHDCGNPAAPGKTKGKGHTKHSPSRPSGKACPASSKRNNP